MNLFEKYKWLSWVVLFLLVLNISALAAIIYFGQSRLRHERRGMPPPMENLTGKAIMDALEMDSGQRLAFHEHRQQFMKETRPFLEELSTTRAEIYKEIISENPSTHKLDSLADELGVLHTRIKKRTVHHYLDVRQTCTPEQRKKLGALYRGMLDSDEPRRGMGRQHRYGAEKGRMEEGRRYRGGRGMHDQDTAQNN